MNTPSSVRNHGRPSAGRTALGAALLVAGCSREAPAPRAPEPSLPPGAVLLVDGLPLGAAEVAPLAADILALYPEYSTLHARRLALTNVFLPCLAARAQDPEGWSRAREACTAATDLERSAQVLEGGFQALGVGLWSLARHLAPGAWSEPLELPGRWVRVRLEELRPHVEPRQELLRLSLVECPFLPPAEAHARIQAAIDRSRLTLIDPTFAEAVPEAWKHRMHATTP